MTVSCKCGSQVLADDVQRKRTTYTDGSTEEHGREYCAHGSSAFWTSAKPVVGVCRNRTDAQCLNDGCFNTLCDRFNPEAIAEAIRKR